MKVCPECKGSKKKEYKNSHINNCPCESCKLMRENSTPCDNCNGMGWVMEQIPDVDDFIEPSEYLKEMEIELIKYMVGYADGFAYDDSEKIFYLEGTWVWFKEIEEWEHLPHLLTRCIEGINRKFAKEDEGWAILQTETAIVIYICYHEEQVFYYNKCGSEDAVKIAAITYIYNKESGE